MYMKFASNKISRERLKLVRTFLFPESWLMYHDILCDRLIKDVMNSVRVIMLSLPEAPWDDQSWNDIYLFSTLLVYVLHDGYFILKYIIILPRTTKLFGDILVSLHPSVRPSVRTSSCQSICPTSRVHSVAPTVLVGSTSDSYILSSNFRRCAACKVYCKIEKFELLAFFFKFVTLTLSCFDLGSDVNH